MRATSDWSDQGGDYRAQNDRECREAFDQRHAAKRAAIQAQPGTGKYYSVATTQSPSPG
ncbi:hypothetical protein [Micromonospora sp. NPDC007230]|uniref:hypothetical protein n=1 Tax=Micromonospora sp. NPDC007230 TaxID=3364237 RepID=UPI00369ECEE1